MLIDPEKIKILIVEDHSTVRQIEVKTLNSLGYFHTIEAANGKEALLRLKEHRDIGLIISDWNMPEMDGYELLIWVRSDPHFKDLPFLIATAQGDKKQEQKAIAAKVSSFVIKPFDAVQLERKIKSAFGIKEETTEQPGSKYKPVKTSDGKLRLKIAHIQITDHLVVGVLHDMIKNKKLSPRHFELDLVRMPGWNQVKDVLENGEVDAACILAPIAMDLFSVDLPIRLVMLTHRGGSIFVRNAKGLYQEPFTDFFREKSFFIPHKLSIHNMLAHMFFKRIGLRPGVVGEGENDVNFEVVSPIMMGKFLGVNPENAGFIVAEPLGSAAIAKDIANLQFLSGEIWPEHPCCALVVRKEAIDAHEDAIHELVKMLSIVGKIIKNNPDDAAIKAVKFLDPEGTLNLQVDVIKKVLTDKNGIKTDDLYPMIEEFELIQEYMHHKMDIGNLIDLKRFIDIRFADAAYQGRDKNRSFSRYKDSPTLALDILERGTAAEVF